MDVPGAVRELRERMVADGAASSFMEINAGLCGDFATELLGMLASQAGLSLGDFLGAWVHGVTDFVKVDPGTGFACDSGGPFDRDLIGHHWKGVVPPEGLDWDDLDRLSSDAGFTAGTHVFLYADGLFYDAEAPDGVASFFDLPFFERVIGGWKASVAGISPR